MKKMLFKKYKMKIEDKLNNILCLNIYKIKRLLNKNIH